MWKFIYNIAFDILSNYPPLLRAITVRFGQISEPIIRQKHHKLKLQGLDTKFYNVDEFTTRVTSLRIIKFPNLSAFIHIIT